MKPIFTLIGMLLFSASAMHAGDIYVSTSFQNTAEGNRGFKAAAGMFLPLSLVQKE